MANIHDGSFPLSIPVRRGCCEPECIIQRPCSLNLIIDYTCAPAASEMSKCCEKGVCMSKKHIINLYKGSVCLGVNMCAVEIM